MNTAYSKEFYHDLLARMIFIRDFEEKAAELYGLLKIRGFLHLYMGEEAIAVGAMPVFRPEDSIVATYREHAHAILRGIPAEVVMAEMYGKQEGCSRGRGGSMHLFDREKRFFGGSAVVGAGLPLAMGVALAEKMRNHNTVTACFFGEGVAGAGVFAESLNLASLWCLPVLFLCENNHYAMGTAQERCLAQTDIAARAAIHKIPAEHIDGMDVIAVLEAVERGADFVRANKKPYFIEFDTYRYCAHSMFDAELYRDKGEVRKCRVRDPIKHFQDKLSADGLLSPSELSAIEEEAEGKVQAAVAFAERGTWEPVSDLLKDVSEEGY